MWAMRMDDPEGKHANGIKTRNSHAYRVKLADDSRGHSFTNTGAVATQRNGVGSCIAPFIKSGTMQCGHSLAEVDRKQRFGGQYGVGTIWVRARGLWAGHPCLLLPLHAAPRTHPRIHTCSLAQTGRSEKNIQKPIGSSAVKRKEYSWKPKAKRWHEGCLLDAEEEALLVKQQLLASGGSAVSTLASASQSGATHNGYPRQSRSSGEQSARGAMESSRSASHSARSAACSTGRAPLRSAASSGDASARFARDPPDPSMLMPMSMGVSMMTSSSRSAGEGGVSGRSGSRTGRDELLASKQALEERIARIDLALST